MNPNEVKKKTVVYRDKEGNVVTSKDQAWSADWTYVYADGRKQVWRTGANEDPEQTGTLQSETTDPDQQKIWEDQKKQEVAKGSAASQESISAPANQPYVMRTGPKDAEHPDGIYYYPNPNFTGGDNKKGTKTTLEQGELVTREIEADGSQGRIINQKPATKAEIEAVQGTQGTAAANRKPVPGKPGVYEVTNASKDPNGNSITETHYEDEQGNRVPTPGEQGASGSKRVPVAGQPGIYQVTNATKDAQGNATEETHFEDEQGNRVPTPTKAEKPTLVDLPSGGKGQLVEDKDNPGTWKAVPVAGTAPTAIGPDLGNMDLSQFGNLVPQIEDRLRKRIQYAQNSGGTYSEADAKRDTDAEIKIAQSRVDEMVGQANAQGNIRNQDVTQRSQTITSEANRMQLSEAAVNAGMDRLKQLGPFIAKAGPGGAEEVVRKYADLYKQYAEGMGVSPNVPPPLPLTQNQQQIMGPGYPSQGGGGGGVTINIGNGQTPPPYAASNPDGSFKPTGGPSPDPFMSGLVNQLNAGNQTLATGASLLNQPQVGMSVPPPGAVPDPQNMDELLSQRMAAAQARGDQGAMSALEQIKKELGLGQFRRDMTPAPGMSFSGGQLRAPSGL